MNPASKDIKDRLEESAYGFIFGTDLFIGIMPDGGDVPDLCVSLRDSGGKPPYLNYELDEPELQFLIRAAKGGYLAAEAKAREVHDALHGVTDTVINATRYLLINAATSPIYIGNDDDNRPLFSINFEVQRTSE